MSNHFSKEIQVEYERTLAQLGPTDPYYSSTTLGITDVIRAHFLIAEFFYQQQAGMGGIGPKNLALLHSALNRQFVGYGTLRKWESRFEVCATLFYGLIKDHPFYDGNKRTALLSLLFHLQKVGFCPSVSKKDFENLAIQVADNSIAQESYYLKFSKDGGLDAEIRCIAKILRMKTRKIDSQHHAISFRELDTILRRFGCALEEPNNNQIGIFKYEYQDRILGLGRKNYRHRIGVIGFPDWTSEVSRGDIKKVREMTKLNSQSGVDSAAFYESVDSLQSLITEYQEPLRRLAEK